MPELLTMLSWQHCGDQHLYDENYCIKCSFLRDLRTNPMRQYSPPAGPRDCLRRSRNCVRLSPSKDSEKHKQSLYVWHIMDGTIQALIIEPKQISLKVCGSNNA